jgi:hypothetical protein
MTETYKIDITLPAAHAAYAKSFWIDKMYKWCEENSIKFTCNQWPRANEQHDWTSQWIFNSSEDAVLFALRWKDNDWGMAHFPV